MEEEQKKRPIRRFLAFLVTAALVLGAIFVVVNWQALNLDAIKRYFTYRSLTKNETGQVESYTYTGGVTSQFACLGDDLLICSSSGIRLYSPSGTAYIDKASHMEHPIISVGGDAALVYDAGGSQLFVYHDREQVFSYTSKADNAILAANINAQGQVVIVTQASGLKGSVTVYNTEYQPVMSVNLSSCFIYDAVLSPDGSTLALATSGQTGGVYNSMISFYSVTHPNEKDEADAECALGTDAVLKLDWHSPDLRVLSEEELYFVSPKGEIAGTYPFNDLYLKGFTLDGDGFVSLLLGKYRAGSAAELVTVDRNAKELARQEINRQVLSMSSAGRYLSILTSDELVIFTQDLKPYHALTGNQGAQKVLQRPDGSVMLISGETARLYLPD